MLKNTLIKKVSLNGKRISHGFDEFNFPVTDESVFILDECTIHPLKSSEQAVLPEGIRTRKAYRVFTVTPVASGEEGKETLADKVEINKEWYEVISVDKWQNGVQSHFEFIAVREELR